MSRSTTTRTACRGTRMIEEQHRLRLADVCAGSERRRRSSGSGYLIATTLVLTARHVVVDRSTGEAWSRIEVNVGHPQSPENIVSRRASVCWWASDGRDVALLELDSPVVVPGMVNWGR